MYEVIILNSAAKELRKLGKPIRVGIIKVLEQLAENPYSGQLLKDDLAALYSYHLKLSGVEYRIAYQIKDSEVIVVVVRIGTRENFYAELKKRL